MRTLHRAGAGLFALTLVIGAAACGSDDDKEGTTDTTASGDTGSAEGDNAAFCDGVVEFNGAVMEVDLDETSSEEDIKATGEQLAPIFAPVAEGAPKDLADDAETIDAALQGLTEGDATAFNEDATFETYMGFLSGAIETCDFASVDVKARDYAFEAPDSMEAGTQAFAFTNTSDAEEHEMALIRKADGVDLSWDELLALPEEEAMSKSVFVGAAYAPPGESGSTLATLEPGDYAMVCFIPVGGAEDGPPHFTQGMIHEFTVE